MLDLIAYEYYRNPYLPHDITTSGEKEETSLNNRYSYGKNATVLVIQDDIINPEGYGLKKGFYNICPDEYLEFLLIYQTGELKAKIPVIKVEKYSTQTDGKQKVKKMSQSAYLKKLKKEQKKYMKGENPNTVDYSEADIEYIREENAWVVLYRNSMFDLYGMIKF